MLLHTTISRAGLLRSLAIGACLAASLPAFAQAQKTQKPGTKQPAPASKPPASNQPAKADEAAPDFVAVLQRNFKAWDRDRNNVLTPAEIDAALADPKLTGDDAAAAGAIKCVTRSGRYRIRRIDLATINDDLRIVRSRKPGDVFNDDWFAPDWQKAFEIARKRADAIGAPFAEPSLETLQVDPIANASLIAALGSMLNANAGLARATVYSLPDGKVQLMLPLWKKPFGPITIAQTAGASTTGNVWARAVECGIDLLNQERFPQANYDGKTPAFERGFERAQSDIRLLMGHQSDVTTFRGATGGRNAGGFEYAPKGSPDGLASQTTQILGPALTGRRMAMAITHGSAIYPANAKGPASQGPLPPGLDQYSFCAILGIDPQAKTITMWNPRGTNFAPTGAPSISNGYPMTNGRWTMPLNDFVQVFSGIVVENNNTATLPGQSKGR